MSDWCPNVTVMSPNRRCTPVSRYGMTKVNIPDHSRLRQPTSKLKHSKVFFYSPGLDFLCWCPGCTFASIVRESIVHDNSYLSFHDNGFALYQKRLVGNLIPFWSERVFEDKLGCCCCCCCCCCCFVISALSVSTPYTCLVSYFIL